MEKKNLTYLSNEIFEHLKHINYDESKEFKQFKLNIMINLINFLDVDNYSMNTDALNNTEIPKYQCTQQEIDYLNRIKFELIQLINNTKNPKIINFDIDRLDLIISLSKFLDPELYMGNIEILKRLEKKQKTLTHKK